jgi:hypothetical protein
MTWYKTAAKQNEFEFMEGSAFLEDNPVAYHSEGTKESLDEIVDNADSQAALELDLKRYSYRYEKVKFPKGKVVIVVDAEDQKWVIDDPENPFSVTGATEWVDSLSGMDLFELYGESDENFWENPPTLYHGTARENIDEIMRDGLDPRDRTRGIANKWTGSAVFMSDNPDSSPSYYEVLLEIDTEAMKADGYTPNMEKEEPITEAAFREAAANALGIEEYYADVESGIEYDTVLSRDPIPAKYLRVLE